MFGSIEFWLWVTTVIALIGTVLNVMKNKYGFLCWIISNLMFAITYFVMGIVPSGFLFSVYFCLSLWGWISWSRTQAPKEATVPVE